MRGRKFFLQWTLAFGGLGIAVPILLMLRFFMFQRPFGEIEFFLWPSSIMLMALESSTTRSTVIAAYIIVVAENVLLYAAVGAVTWPLVYVIQKTRSRHDSA